MHKTGTTALQLFFHENREILKENKIHYFSGSLSDYYFVSSLKGKVEESYARNRIKELSEIKDYDVLFSCESLIEDEKIPDVLDLYFKEFDIYSKFNIKIIYYLRRQDYWLESSFNQITKSIEWNKMTFNEYLKSSGLDFYLDQIFNWENKFGRGNFNLRIYEENQDKEWLIKDFLSILDVDFNDKFVVRNDESGNQSINPEIIQSLTISKQIFKSQNEIDEFITLLSKYIQKNRQYFYLDKEERKEILFKYSEFNRMLFEKYFNGSIEDNFYNEFPDCNFVFDNDFYLKNTICFLSKVIKEEMLK